MRPLLDDLELPQVQEIMTHERRMLAEHKPPGMAGSLFQNLGRQPTHLILGGVATGPKALEFVTNLDEKFRAGIPVPFIADIISDTEIEEIVIDDLRLQEVAGKPQQFAYVLTLREYIEPVEPEDASFLDADILEDAQTLMDQLIDGLNIDLDFATGLEQFVPKLSGLLDRLIQFRNAVEEPRP